MNLENYKLSQWVRLALADIKKVENDDRYIVDMSSYHLPNSKCRVCFAGAVMAKTLKGGIEQLLEPVDFTERDFLVALDWIRIGYIRSALTVIDKQDQYSVQDYIDVVSYCENPRQWRKDMFKIVRMLEKAGL